MRAAIICNGEFPRREYPLNLLSEADIVVCCDGAVRSWERWCRKTGSQRLPDVVIGDMDSITPSLQRRYASVLVHESEQDHNDMTKAVRYILGRYPEVTAISIFGATGKRADHTIGNLSLLMEYPRLFELGNRSIEIVSDYGVAFAVTDSCELFVGEGRSISIFSPDNSLQIKSSGLEWPLDDVVFDNWWKATLNRATSDLVTLTFSHPSRALVILD